MKSIRRLEKKSRIIKVLGDDLINRIVDAANQYKTNQYKASV